MNKLYYGDCLDVLKHSIEDESIDLIYIDPPFNSKRAYNVLFESIDMTDAKAQKEAFADTWSNVSYIDEMSEIQDLDLDLFRFLQNLDNIRISKGAVSYLTIMAHRIFYMRKKLKDTGSFYLHCDPTMSHYLKLVCDLIFGKKNFVAEIVWGYGTPSGGRVKGKKPVKGHEIILSYAKQFSKHTFNRIFLPYSEKYINERFIYTDEAGRQFRKRKRGEIMTRQYLDESPGVPLSDCWTDIKQLYAYHLLKRKKEELNYPTQKPEALLERIIQASSNEGDTVADFFCGCGTTIAIAQKLNRQWIGADISHLAVRLVYDRLLKPYERKPKAYQKIREKIEINGFPKDIASARDLARKTDKSRMRFQDWIIEIMMNGVANPKKTADGGYDGYLTFNVSEKGKDVILIEVKSGNVSVKEIRAFTEVVKKENASIGAFVCFSDQVTKPMLEWAKKNGYYKPELWGNKHDKIQIITVEDLLEGKSVRFPSYQNLTFKTATNIPMNNSDNSMSLFEKTD